MKPIILRTVIPAIMIILSIHTVAAQSLAPVVVSSTGYHHAGADLALSYTLGEISTETFSVTGLDLTQGFHQSGLIVESVPEELPDIQSLIKTWPNPFNRILYFTVNQERPGTLEINIYDLTGKKIFVRMLRNCPVRYSDELNLSSLPGGLYLLKVHSPDFDLNHTIRIQKQP